MRRTSFENDPENGDTMKSLGLIALGLCCIAAPLAAQQDTTHARRPGQPAGAPMGRGMARGERGGMDEMVSMMHEMMGPMIQVMEYTPDRQLGDRLGIKNE